MKWIYGKMIEKQINFRIPDIAYISKNYLSSNLYSIYNHIFKTSTYGKSQGSIIRNKVLYNEINPWDLEIPTS